MANSIVSGCGVYAIECADGRAYVGGTVSITDRWGSHRFDLRRGNHRNGPLQAAWHSLGESAFTFLVLEATSPADLKATEQRWIDRRAEGGLFNLYRTAGSPKGTLHTDETRARNAAAQRGLQAGDANPNARLTADDVRDIRRRAAAGETHKAIAARLGITRECAGRIARGQAWAHVV